MRNSLNDRLYLQAKVSSLNIALAKIILKKISRPGVGIRMSLVENFCKINQGGIY